VLGRLMKCRKIDQVIVATSQEEDDDPISELMNDKGYHCFRGSLHNVLERFYEAAKHYNVDRIVRVTSDCPCIDPMLVDDLIDYHESTNADFTSSAIDRTFPIGMDASVFSFAMLKEAVENATEERDKEHVTSYFYLTNPQKYSISVFRASPPLNRPDIRITLDTNSDYTLLCLVYDYLYKENKYFGLKQIVNLFDAKAWMLGINKKSVQKKVYKTVQDELEDVLQYCKKQDLGKAADFISFYKSKNL